MRSMSRAVFAVVTYGSIDPVFDPALCSASRFASAACFTTSAGPFAYGRSPTAICSGVRSHVTGVLCATPRGSNPTMS